MLGGNFRKFATESNGISGTFCALALLCASLGPAASRPATMKPAMTHFFMRASASGGRNLYEQVAWFKRHLDDILPKGPRFADSMYGSGWLFSSGCHPRPAAALACGTTRRS